MVFGRALGMAMLLSVFAMNVFAQSFPSKPVTIVVPYPAGGSSDAFTRALGQKLSEMWGQPVIVDNRPGAATMIASQYVAKASPDGHTLLFVTDSFAINKILYAKTPYDPVKDFTPVTVVAHLNQLIAVNASVPVTTLSDLVNLAKSKPGTLNYGSYGAGSPPHLDTELLKHIAGIDLVHIPYKGVAPMATDLVAGVVQVGVLAIGTTVPLYKAGRIKALAIDGTKRSPLLPDVPTFVEAGYPEMQAAAWWGIVAPAATPPQTIERLNRDIVRVLNEPEFREKRMINQGLDPVGNSPTEFAALISQTMTRWEPIIRAANIKPD